MKRIRLSGIYEWGIVAVLFLVVLHAPFVVAAGSVFPGFETVIKAWKELALAVLAVIGLVLLTRHGLWQVFLKSWAVRLAFAFIGLHVLLAVAIGGQSESVVAGLMIDLRFVAMFLLAYVLILVRSRALRRIVYSVAAGGLAVLGFGLLQITVLPDDILRGIGYSRETITPFTTIDSNPDYVRINSTLRGPNPLGAIVVLYASLAFSYLIVKRRSVSGRRRLLAAGTLLASVAISFATFSRSAYIALIAALAVIVLSVKRLSRRFVLAGLMVAVVTSGALVLVSSTDWYSNVILHEDPESTVVSKSNDGHVESLILGAERTVQQPFGAGIGSTGSASLYDEDSANDTIIENYYFVVAHESGWLGATIFIALFSVIMVRLYKNRSNWVYLAVFASGAGLAIIALLLPVWADDTVAIIWWGLAGALVASRGIIDTSYGRRTGKQATTGTS